MKLSIIIPVYQVEKTLRRCVDSVVSQSFRDWQMILVNDASTDKSGKICDEYVKADHRIQVVHLKRNEGLSAARNKGIEKARGEYLTFIDSDDYIAADSLKTLFEIINVHPDYDILEYPVYEHYGSKKQHLLQFARKEYTDMLSYWLEGEAYRHAYAWNKIYKKQVFQNVQFPVGRTFEDVFTLPLLLKNCHLIATTNVGMYHYCFNPNGITQQATAEDLSDLLAAHVTKLNQIDKELKRQRDKGSLTSYISDYYKHILNIQLDIYDASGKLFVPRKKTAAKGIQAVKFPILPYSDSFKLKLLHTLGLTRLCQLHRLFRRNR